MSPVIAALLGLSILAGQIEANWKGPRAVHYPAGVMGASATANGLDWHRVYRNGRAKYVVNNRLYDGIASTPLCGSQRVGGVVWGTFYNRLTEEWEDAHYITGDVTNPPDRAGQLSGNRLVELNWEAQNERGYTIDQGWGWGPVKGIGVQCP
jgi:hypothetical protein